MRRTRGIVRAAAYLPGKDSPQPGRRSPDEDRFTIEATAIERLVEGRAVGSGATIRPVGASPSVAPWAFPALLGVPVDVLPPAEAQPGLLAAVTAAVGSSRPEIVVASESVGEPGSGAPTRGRVPLDAAVALWVDEIATRRDLVPGRGPDRADASPIATAIEWFQGVPGGDRSGWVGDWVALSTAPPVNLDGEAAVAPPKPSVSEGAYWPRPRYLEGLPSRWRMLGERCGACGATSFPIRGRCRGCGRANQLTTEPLPKEGGVVRALTWIGEGGQPTEFDAQVAATGAYGVAIVEIAPGIHGTFQVADAIRGGIVLGARVGTRLRRLYFQEGEWRYGRKAVPFRGDARATAGRSGESG